MKTLITCAIVVLAWFRCYSQTGDTIVPDRPGQTNPPNIVSPGVFQLETGFSRESKKTGGLQTINLLYNTSLIRIGILENCELRLSMDYAGTNSDSSGRSTTIEGFNPVSLGTKLAVCPEKGFLPQTSINFSIALPYIGNKEFIPAYLAPSFFLLMQNTLSDRYTLGYNLGLQWDGTQPNATAVYSISLSAALSERITVFAESFGFSTEKSGSEYRSDLGCTYLVNADLQADLSGGIGLNSVAPDSFIAFGIAWRIGKQ